MENNTYINENKYKCIKSIKLGNAFKILILKTVETCKIYTLYGASYKKTIIPKNWLSYTIVPINMKEEDAHSEFNYRFRNEAELYKHIDFIIEAFKSNKVELINTLNNGAI
jgi:hypothetical protein